MMPLPLHLVAVLGLLAASTAKKSSGSGSGIFLIFIVVIAGVYLLFIAPQRRKQRAQMAQKRTFEIGDEVVTTGGIYGRVESNDGDRVALDISDGIIVEVAKSSIAKRVEPAPATAAPEAAMGDDVAEDVDEHDWEPPVAGEAAANGATLNGGGNAAHGDWADPWAPPADGEKGASGTAGSA